MAIIKPFKGIRPPQDLVEQVASRPYDVLNSAEARAEAEGNEKSLYHIIKPEIDFPVGTDEHDERVYRKAAENFRMFQEKGWLVQDDKENYYVYAQTMNGKTQYGLVVGAYVPDYMNGVIKKHELTRRDKEEDRMKHVRVNNANIEPVFFAYPDNAALDAIISRYTAGKPVYDFIAPGDGFGHTFWIIDKQEDIDAITQEFAQMPALYIADGHHRSAAAALVGAEKAKQNPNHRGDEEYNYFIALLLQQITGLTQNFCLGICNYHRAGTFQYIRHTIGARLACAGAADNQDVGVVLMFITIYSNVKVLRQQQIRPSLVHVELV